MAVSYGSQIGEAIGKLAEQRIQDIVSSEVEKFDFSLSTRRKRPSAEKMINASGNTYQIDFIIYDKRSNPLVLIESKYLRYTKHCRDKASWTCVAHYRLRLQYPTIRRSIAVLSGSWTEASIRLMESFGIDVLKVDWPTIRGVLTDHRIQFDWAENDNETPRTAWDRFSRLSEQNRKQIAADCLQPIESRLQRLVSKALKCEERAIPQLEKVELLIKTSANQFILREFGSTSDLLRFLISDLHTPVQDLTKLVEKR